MWKCQQCDSHAKGRLRDAPRGEEGSRSRELPVDQDRQRHISSCVNQKCPALALTGPSQLAERFLGGLGTLGAVALAWPSVPCAGFLAPALCFLGQRRSRFAGISRPARGSTARAASSRLTMPRRLGSPFSAKITGGGEFQSLQPDDCPADVDGHDSPISRLGGQRPFDRHSQPLEQFPGVPRYMLTRCPPRPPRPQTAAPVSLRLRWSPLLFPLPIS